MTNNILGGRSVLLELQLDNIIVIIGIRINSFFICLIY
jgi:hypothetical protein